MRFAIFLIFSLLAWGADNWPGWRGPDANGVSALTRIPISWGVDRNVAWKIAVEGRGHSVLTMDFNSMEETERKRVWGALIGFLNERLKG